MKTLLKIILALVIILVALILAHPLWIGPVVRTAVSRLAPKFLGVPAQLDGFSLNAYTGRVTLDGFVLDNPPGYREKFVTVGHLCVDVDPTTILSDVIVVEEISLADLYLSLMTDEKKVYNYETVARACAPAEDKPAAEPKPAKESAAKKAEKDKPSKKIIIDLIQLQNVLVQWERLSLPLPSFRMTGLGRGTNGAELDVAWKEFEKQFIAALGPLAQGLQAALDGANGSIDSGLKAAADVSKSVGDVQKALTDIQKATKDGTQGSAETATKSIDEAAKTINESVKSLKTLFGK